MQMQSTPRIAVVTPYCTEPAGILVQCKDSVGSQTIPCTHFAVADGSPSEVFEHGHQHNVQHVRLPAANADNGNTPRGVGTLLALAQGYDFIAYLDADNWFQPNHIESLLKVHASTGAPVLCARRSFHRMDGRPLGVVEASENQHRHVDTSCYLVHRSCASALMIWGRMPKPLAPVCDRVFFLKLRHSRYHMAFSDQRTVAFRSRYTLHYEALGEQPPPGSKEGDFAETCQYLRSDAGTAEVIDALGFYPSPAALGIG
jgi:Glycosyl transferase family 2